MKIILGQLFFNFFIIAYAVDTHFKCLSEALLMSTHNIHHIMYVFIFYKSIHFGYSLQAHRSGSSNEYPKHVFIKKKKRKNKYPRIITKNSS